MPPSAAQLRAAPGSPADPRKTSTVSRLLSAPRLKVTNFLWFHGKPISWQKVKVLTSKQNAPKAKEMEFQGQPPAASIFKGTRLGRKPKSPSCSEGSTWAQQEASFSKSIGSKLPQAPRQWTRFNPRKEISRGFTWSTAPLRFFWAVGQRICSCLNFDEKTKSGEKNATRTPPNDCFGQFGVLDMQRRNCWVGAGKS